MPIWGQNLSWAFLGQKSELREFGNMDIHLTNDSFLLDKELASLVTDCAHCGMCRQIFVMKNNNYLIRCVRGIFQRKGQEELDLAEICPEFHETRIHKPHIPYIFEIH